jgi:hypothetical protein
MTHSGLGKTVWRFVLLAQKRCFATVKKPDLALLR